MTRATKKTGAALAGAVALASTAFAIGSQSGDGSATAGTRDRAAASDAQVRTAFTRDGDRRERGLTAFAEGLGVSADKLRTALEDVRDELPRPGRSKADLSQRLADELGIAREKVESVLRDFRPERRDRDERRGRGRGPFGGDLTGLARAMGVEESRLQAAFDKLRAEHEAEHEQRRAAFAKALAAKLGISAEKVEQELEDAPFGGRGPGGFGRHRGPR